MLTRPVRAQEMASRHRVRAPCLQIIKTATVPAALTKRINVKQFHDSKIKFPLTRRIARCEAILPRLCTSATYGALMDWKLHPGVNHPHARLWSWQPLLCAVEVTECPFRNQPYQGSKVGIHL